MSLVLNTPIKMQKNELCVNFYTHVRNTKLSGIGSVIRVFGTKANVYDTNIVICSINLPQGHSYLLLGLVNADISTVNNVMSAGFIGEGESTAIAKTVLSQGGGCTIWQYSSNGGEYSLITHGFINNSFNFTGRILAIQLN